MFNIIDKVPLLELGTQCFRAAGGPKVVHSHASHDLKKLNEALRILLIFSELSAESIPGAFTCYGKTGKATLEWVQMVKIRESKADG